LKAKNLPSLKVALISEEFPPYTFGGVASQCNDLVHILSKKGVYVKVFCGRSQKLTVEKWGSHLEVIRLPFFDMPPRFLWFQLQNLKSLLKLFKTCTVLHSTSPHASGLLAYFKDNLGKPWITSVHSVPLDILKVLTTNFPFSSWSLGDFGYHVIEYPLDHFLLKSCLTNSDHIIACGLNSFSGLERIYKVSKENISVIYNGINFDKIEKPALPTNSNHSYDPKIIFYGRLYALKGILHLVKALVFVKQEFPNVTLEIFGRGPLETKIRKWLLQLSLKDVVHLRGYLPRTKLLKEIQAADIVTLPSFYETGPFIAALEAMAYKKPLICFDFPFAREFIHNMENGVLAEPGNVEDLAQKILLLLTNKDLCYKLGENAHEYIKKNHNWDRLVEKYIEIYESFG